MRVVWVTMWAWADRSGTVWASKPGLAHEARVTLAECESALEVLCGPDPHSRTPDDGGRRVRPVDGGWLLVNHEKYRESGGDKEANRQRQARYRDRQRERNTRNALLVTETTLGDGESPPAPALALTPEEKKQARSKSGDEHPAFGAWYDQYPRHIGRRPASIAYAKANGGIGELKGQQVLQDGAVQFAQYCFETACPLDKTPYPATWLNQERWLDNYPEQAAAEARSSTETRHDAGQDRRSAKAADEHDDGDRSIPTL